VTNLSIGGEKFGTFYGVGVGPGDPELMTVKAQRILRQVPVLCVPKSREEGGSYALGIISHLMEPNRQRLMELVFPMTKDRAKLEEYWDKGLDQLLVPLRAGEDVAFVTEGDPSIYSTFLHMFALMRERHPEIPVEVVPGVSSINASAAAAGMPLVDGAERLAILPATYEGNQLVDVLERFDTVVLLKVHRVMDRVLDVLEKLEMVDRAVYVSRCGSPEQRVVTDVASLRGQDLEYLSLMIVRRRRG